VSAPAQVVLLSGGLDSMVNLVLAREAGPVVLAVTADYGQTAAAAEIGAAAAACRRYGIPHRSLDLRWLGVSATSANGVSSS